MNQILGRIRIKNSKGKELLYTTDKTDLENFGLKYDIEFPNIRVIGKGTEFQIDNIKYKVVDMYTYFYDETDNNDSNKGINLIGSGYRHPFNFDITYYVDEVDK